MRSLAFSAALAFAAGAAAVLAFSPFDLWPAGLAAHALLVHLWLRAGSPRAALLLGYAFGLGLFLTGVSWVYISLHRFGAMPAPLAALATFGFCAWLAIFPALTGWLQARSCAPEPPFARRSPSPRSGRSPSGSAAGTSPVSLGSARDTRRSIRRSRALRRSPEPMA